jgi:hypothetical protein
LLPVSSLRLRRSQNIGDAYTFAEIEKMSKDAGFSRVEMVETPLGFGRMIVAYR